MATSKITDLSWLEISRTTLFSNIKNIRRNIPKKTKIMAMVKANAYGHGLFQIAPIFAPKIDFFGVHSITEAKIIRNLKLATPILITGPISPTDFEFIIKNNISLSVFSLQYLKSISKFPIKIHLKINTGMNRLGFNPFEINSAIKIIQNSPLKLEGVYTHFHSADNSQTYTLRQFQSFLSVVTQLKTTYPNILAHSANSAAIFNYPQTHLDMVRPGIRLYKNSLSWKAKITQSRILKNHDTVGYSATYLVNKLIYQSIIPVGYSDGLDRGLSNQFPFLGRVSMNFAAIQTPTLLTENTTFSIPLYQFSKKLNTIDYEILSRLNPLIPRIIVK